MGSKIAPILGIYERNGSKLYNPTTTLLLVQRKKPTKKKPLHYLLRVNSSGQRNYVTSLYETDCPGEYRAEYNGISYTVTLSTDRVEIRSGDGQQG